MLKKIFRFPHEEIFIFPDKNKLFDEIKISSKYLSEFPRILFKIKSECRLYELITDKFVRTIIQNDLNLSIRETQLNNFQIYTCIQRNTFLT